MLQMRTAARMRPHAVDSSELSSFRTQTSVRKHYLPRDPRLGGLLLALCDLAVFAAVIALIAMLLAPGGAERFSTSWPHFTLTSVLAFIVAHSLASSYDIAGAVHTSLFDFVIKPAILTCTAVTFSYMIEVWLGRSAVEGEFALSIGELSAEHYVIVFATLAMAGERLLGYGLLNRWQAAGHLSTNVVVFGAETIGQRLVKVVREEYADSVEVVGIFDDRTQRAPDHVHGIAVEGGIDALIEFVKSTPAVDKVLIALPMSAESRILQLLTKLRSLAVDVALVPDFVGMRLERQFARAGQPPLLSVLRRPQSEFDWLVKRSFDFTTSLVLLIALSPLLALTALAIRLDSPGPILFRQPRLGLNNKEFNVLKFRSMYVEKADLEAREQTKRDDARVTRVGTWLRRLSIDELPQLFNVLAGDMSLVGPRPHALGMQVKDRLCDEIVREYAVRHRMRPGITGWAQVRGLRGAVDEPALLEARVNHDIYYIDNWSFFFDLRILMMTVIELIRPRNAF
ncbi:undecaprenyl-phosphate glucose phosphotransferase [Dongia deserti]|uniref:undecaprenyl-phosphate glucose phosphotransferase n=1 Tax=Dongia deserti TaxID=2268030 RepID=UPI000E64DFC1|nr:undecaprenyl-phosphate glucose phosphotransferase [Dongia deserti]